LKERRTAKRKKRTNLLHVLIRRPTIQRPFVDYLHNIHKSRIFHKFLSGQRTIQGDAKLHASFQQQLTVFLEIGTFERVVITVDGKAYVLKF
jgi:hypothetical protein